MEAASSNERLAGLRRLQQENTRLNGAEYDRRQLMLASTPQNVFFQLNAVCNADCIFCSKGYDYPIFELDPYLEKFGDEVIPLLSRAEKIHLTGSGEFLGLPDSKKILRFFNSEFPHVEKLFATNASYLGPQICELIANGGSRYSLQISLHASNPELNRTMMRYNAFDKVMKQLRHLIELRDKNGGNPRIRLMFVLTTFNIEDLPNFVRLAAELKADEVAAGYFYIYESQQKYLSLYFKPDLANRYIDEARKVADELGVVLRLPPKFGQPPHQYLRADCCSEPWTQVMLNVEGNVLPCDVFGDFPETLAAKPFQEIWNGPAYRTLRANLRQSKGCILTCPRHNPSSVNEWDSHVIHRSKGDAAIVREYNEAMKRP
jgi:MoaA/NifB/PqqE/SkfB family radical SAM enzyme